MHGLLKDLFAHALVADTEPNYPVQFNVQQRRAVKVCTVYSCTKCYSRLTCQGWEFGWNPAAVTGHQSSYACRPYQIESSCRIASHGSIRMFVNTWLPTRWRNSATSSGWAESLQSRARTSSSGCGGRFGLPLSTTSMASQIRRPPTPSSRIGACGHMLLQLIAWLDKRWCVRQ